MLDTLYFSSEEANNAVSIDDQCLSRDNYCDGDPPDGVEPGCRNGADESKCNGIWPGDIGATPMDVFGRFKSQAQGYLYFVSHGRSFLYCANPAIFTEERRVDIGRALCVLNGYGDVKSITYDRDLPPGSRQRIDAPLDNAEEEEQFQNCFSIYIVCEKYHL